MAHLKSDLRDCCKECCYLSHYDDHLSSWYFCGFLGGALDSAACKNVERVVNTVFEKREGDVIPRFYDICSSPFCTRSFTIDQLKLVVKSNIRGEYCDAILYFIENHKAEI